VSFIAALSLLASSNADLVEVSEVELAARAEAAFAHGVRLRDDRTAARPHFLLAAQCYDQLRHRGTSSVALYRNLGRAWLLAGELPRCVLTYRQGLHRWPFDRGLYEDLAAAREQVVLAPYSSIGRPPTDLFPPWWPPLREGLLAAGAALIYVLACVCLTRWWMTRSGNLLLSGVAGIMAAGVLATLVVIEARVIVDAQTHPVVVIAEDGVLLRRGDGLRFPPRYETPVNRGVEARLLFQRGDWLQIELGGGEIGWISRSYALVDEP
jgi:hypothetical protein